MNTTDKEFMIRIKADIEKAVKDMRRMSGEIEKQGSSGKRTKKSLDGLGQGYQHLAAAVGAYLSVATAVKALKIADDYSILQRRIKTATRETGDYVAVSKELYQISQRNGTALKDTVDIFQRLSLQAKALGVSNDEVLRLTDTVQKLGVIGGSSQAAMSAGLMQFSQAMASGTVRAEEINSIMENLPELAVRIEKGLKFLPGTLKQAVNEGKVLSRDVFQAILEMAPEVAREFRDIPMDLQRATQLLETSFAQVFNSLEKSHGIVDSMAFFFGQMSHSIDLASASGGGFSDFWVAMGFAGPEAMIKFERTVADLRKQFANASKTDLQELMRLHREMEGAAKRMQAIAITGVNVDTDKGFQALKRYLVKLRAESEALAAKFKSQAPTPSESGKKSSSAPVVDPKIQKQIDRLIASLKDQAATYGMTARQAAVYRLEQEKIPPGLLAQVKATAQVLDVLDAQKQALKDLGDAEASYLDQMYNRIDAEDDLAIQAVKKAAKVHEDFKQRIRDVIDPTAALKETILDLKLALELASSAAEKEKISEAIERMYGQIDQIENGASEMSQYAVKAAREIQSAFTDFLFDPVSDGMDGMLAKFAITLHQMASEALAAQLAEKMFGDYGKTGKMGGWVGGLINEVFQFHDGGIVGHGGTSRTINPLAFASAPRYHSGGIVGLKPLEMPAILQKGEEVLPRSDPRHVANGGAPPQFNIAIVDERKAMEEFIASPAASPYVVHHIKRNAQVIKGILT